MTYNVFGGTLNLALSIYLVVHQLWCIRRVFSVILCCTLFTCHSDCPVDDSYKTGKWVLLCVGRW